jgi:hypothetical protein
MAAISILVGGDPLYAAAARESVLSVLDYTSFDIYIGISDHVDVFLPQSKRIKILNLPSPVKTHRAYRFLQKFDVLKWCVEECSEEYIILLDADAVILRHLSDKDLEVNLSQHGLAMVEQTGIRGSSMNRKDFLDHFCRHSLAFIHPEGQPPPIERFRFYNSGVVMGRIQTLEELVDWAQHSINTHQDLHQIGEHMIADQDYFQVWANILHPDQCTELSWKWNHCELWDDDFPKPNGVVAHFSNFCHGPSEDTIVRMKKLRRRGNLLAVLRDMFR